MTAKVLSGLDRRTLQEFVVKHTTSDATVYTDQANAYNRLPRKHEIVTHSIGEYVRESKSIQTGLNPSGQRSSAATRACIHKMSLKHLDRYINEFSARHNMRLKDTATQMEEWVRNAARKRLTYQDLVA